MTRTSYLLRWVELISCFVLIPLVILALNFQRIFVGLYAIGTLTLIFLIGLFFAPHFDRSTWFKWRTVVQELPGILLRATIGAGLLILLVWLWIPERLFAFPRQNFRIWVFVTLLYPIFSAWPQEIMYRSYFFHRYRPLFAQRSLFLASNVFLFAAVHVVFANWVAPMLTLVGGLLFTINYERTKSLPSVWLEHTIFGNLIFTIGLGPFFYVGAAFPAS